MTAYIIDTETTGEEPVPEVIELAVAKAVATQSANAVHIGLEPFFIGRFKPTNRIKFSAMAVHHILPEELEGCPSSVLAKAELPTDMEYMIGHNVDYDWTALGQPACRRICTLAIARYIWPGNDGHSLGAMSYQLATDLPAIREALKGSHSAGDDVTLCGAVLSAMWETEQMAGIDSWEKLWQFSEIARIPVYWAFGKYKGDEIAKTDRGYLLWCLRQPDMDQYVKIACRNVLGPR